MQYFTFIVSDKNELGLAAGVPLLDIDISSSLGFDWTNKTVRSRALFSASNGIPKLREKLSSGVCPVYVASVDYGAVYYISIESNMNSQDLQTALEAKELGATGTYAINSSNSTIKVTQVGGSAEMGKTLTEAILSGKTAINLQAVLEGQTLSSAQAVPVQYKLRNASDHSLASVVMASDYTMKEYVKVNQSVSIRYDEFFANGMSDGAGVPEFTATIKITAHSQGKDTVILSKSLSGEGGNFTAKPNAQATFVFQNFDPANDYFLITGSVTEADAFSDDYATGTKNIYFPEWNTPQMLTIGGASAGGRYTVTVLQTE